MSSSLRGRSYRLGDDDEAERGLRTAGQGNESFYSHHIQPTRKRHWYEISAGKTAIIMGVALGIGTLAAIIGGHGSGHSQKDQTELCQWDSPRLPSSYYTAKEYRWFIAPEDIEGDSLDMSGVVVAELNLQKATKCIVMNSHNLEYDAETVFYRVHGDTDTSKKVNDVQIKEENDQIIIHLPETVGKNKNLQLTVHYKGKLSQDMQGLYVSTYKAEGVDKKMVSTQFEATYARRAFPCLDEPAFKAKFNISIGNVPEGFTALSNMPVKERQDGGKTVAFEQSVPMSTYLVALAVGELDAVSKQVNVGSDNEPHMVNLTVWGTKAPTRQDQLQYALDVAADILPFYSNFFRIPFPLPKTDLIAIPDFAAGAMENWGLITFRETALLADKKTSSVSSLQRVAVVVSHELAHQWFGNLVTMAWWNELWLNEGFATFMEYRGVDHFDSTFELLSTFLTTDVQEAMANDDFGNSHSLTRKGVKTPGQIEEMFDSISYSKGASVINMLSHFANQKKSDSFNDGLHEYLEKHKYGNAESSDLWEAIGHAANINSLQDKMDQYTQQPGFAVVVAGWTDSEGWSSGKGDLELCQMRLLRSKYSYDIAKGSSRADELWWVPINWVLGSSGGETGPVKHPSGFSSRCRDETISFDADSQGWIKFNSNQTGYYRVLYPVNLYEKFLTLIVTARESGEPDILQQLPADDRAGIIDDLLSIVLSGDGAPVKPIKEKQHFKKSNGNIAEANGVNISYAFNFLVNAVRNESQYSPWITALSHLYSLDQKLFTESDTCYTKFTEKVVETIRPLVTALDWDSGSNEDASPIRIKLRNSMFEAASYFGYGPIIDEANSLFKNGSIPPNLVSLVYRTVVRWGDSSDFKKMQNIYEAESDPARKSYALMALAASQKKDLLEKALEYAFDPKKVRSQDSPSVLAAVARNPYGRRVAWKFYKEKGNFDLIKSRYGSGGFALGKIVLSTGSHFTTEEMFKDVQDFYGEHDLEAASLEIEQALESIQGNMEFLNTQKQSLCETINE